MDDAESGATASKAGDPDVADRPREPMSDDTRPASAGKSSGLLGAIETLLLGDREDEVPLETQYKLPDEYLGTFKDERENYRSTLRWLLTAYGAIGTVLVAGLSFTSLHDLGGGDLWLALIGASSALGAVAAVVVVTARATVSVPVKYAEIAAPPRRSAFGPITGNPVRFLNEMFKTGEGNLLRDAFNDDIVQFNTAYQDGKHPENELAKALARGGLTVLVSYHAMRYRFRVATRLIFVAVLGVAIGVVLFAYAAGAGDAEVAAGGPPATASQALSVEISLTDDGKAVLSEALGAECLLEPVAALATSGSNDSFDVITLPHADCEAFRFELTPALGIPVAICGPDIGPGPTTTVAASTPPPATSAASPAPSGFRTTQSQAVPRNFLQQIPDPDNCP
jgi:hypothetical protein